MNGVPINMTWSIRPTNWVEVGDLITINFPPPAHMTDASKCLGDGYWLQGDLKCNKSGDMQTVIVNISVTGRYGRDGRYKRSLREALNPELPFLSEDEDPITVYDPNAVEPFNKHKSRGRRLIEERIPTNELMLLTITNIETPASNRPTN